MIQNSNVTMVKCTIRTAGGSGGAGGNGGLGGPGGDGGRALSEITRRVVTAVMAATVVSVVLWVRRRWRRWPIRRYRTRMGGQLATTPQCLTRPMSMKLGRAAWVAQRASGRGELRMQGRTGYGLVYPEQ